MYALKEWTMQKKTFFNEKIGSFLPFCEPARLIRLFI